MRKWYNVELSQNKAREFKKQLENVEFGQDFVYEVSACGELSHFELYLNENEVETCNLILDFVNCIS